MALLELDDADLTVINDALVRMPFAAVVGLINKINQQLADQRRPAKANPGLHVDETPGHPGAPMQSPDGSAVNKDPYLAEHGSRADD